MWRLILAWAVVASGCERGASSASQAPADAGGPEDASPLRDDAEADADAPTPDAAGQDASVAAGCAVSFVWDPRGATVLQSFPDDYYTRVDPTTATGLRPYLGPDLATWLASIPGQFGAMYRKLEQLDGWGTTAGVVLRFSGPVAAPPEGAIRLLGTSEGVGVDIPFEIESIDDGAGLILWPMVPLRPASRHAVVVTRGLTAADGGCVSPSAGMLDALAGVAPLEAMGERFVEAFEWAGVEPEAAVAAVAFTTQTIEDESVAIAADIAQRTYTWSQAPSCIEGPLFRECDGTFTALDYRGPDGLVAGPEQVVPYTLHVRAWLPLGPSVPRPVVIFGPGLGSDLDISRGIAEITTPLNVVTVAIDAPVHGRHPTAAPDCTTELCRTTAFFGVDLLSQSLDLFVARDHFRESTYDKLQLVQLLLGETDLDGDGNPDTDPTRIAYFAASLGGIMGPEFLALSPDVSAGLLNVPGGRISSIMAEGEATALLVQLLTPPGTTASDKARLFPMLQTILERGDSANYAPHVLFDRLPGAGETPPDVLVNLAMSDRVIPTVSTRALARALGIPHVPPVFRDFDLATTTEVAPVSGNLDDGGTTAGLFQLDRGVRMANGPVEPADHDIGLTVEGRLQITHFLQTWADTGLPEIIDPYEVLGTPPLPAP